MLQTRRKRVPSCLFKWGSSMAVMVACCRNTPQAVAFTNSHNLDARRRQQLYSSSSLHIPHVVRRPNYRYGSVGTCSWFVPLQKRLSTTKTRLWYSPGEQELEKMTVKELKQLLKDSDLVLERGVLSSLKRKQDWIDFLKENLVVNGGVPVEEEEEEEAPPAIVEEEVTSEASSNIEVDTMSETIADEDDSDYDMPIDKSYQDYKDRLEELVDQSYNSPETAVRAQKVFDEMYEAFMFGYENLEPQADIYNLMISIYGKSANAKVAQLILDRMRDEEINTAQPNVDSFVQVMDAWCHAQEPSKAQQVFLELQQCQKDEDGPPLELTTDAYNALIKVWLKFSVIDPTEAAQKAETILREMLEQPDAQPNLKTWERVIKCFSAARTADSTEKVLELLEEMEEQHGLEPDTEVYNAVIRAIALNRDYSLRKKRGVLAESILYDMLTEYKTGTNPNASPNVGTFINTIYAYRGSPETSAGYKAEKLLQLLEGMAVKQPDLVPNVKVYNAVIDVIGRTRDTEKAARCLQVLERMEDHNIQPNVRSYNAILNACAYTYSKDPQELMQTFRIAVQVMNELRNNENNNDDIKPNAVSYGLFLTSCARLMPPTPKREAVVENMFRKCCLDGQVSDFVLESFREAASEDLQERLLKDQNKKWSLSVAQKRQVKK